MFTSVWTVTGADNVDRGVTCLRDEILPVLSSQRGYRGTTASTARSEGVLGIVSLWDTEADRQAGDGALRDAREKAVELVGGDLTVETFEQVVAEVNEPAMVGSALIMIRVSVDPAKIEENLSFFKSEILPQIKAAPGFRSLQDMIDHNSGNGILSSAWTDQEAMRLAAGQLIARRPETVARGTNFRETSLREIVLADLP